MVRKGIKKQQNKVEKALSQLSESDRSEWNHLVRFNANYPDLKEFLAERGQEVTIQNLSIWWIQNRPRGKEAIAANLIATDFIGTDGNALLQMSAVITARLISILKDILDEENISQASRESQLTNITNLLRELRQSASEISKAEVVGDRDALVKAGAIELAQELEKIFNGSPFAKSLESGIRAAMSKLDEQKSK